MKYEHRSFCWFLPWFLPVFTTVPAKIVFAMAKTQPCYAAVAQYVSTSEQASCLQTAVTDLSFNRDSFVYNINSLASSIMSLHVENK